MQIEKILIGISKLYSNDNQPFNVTLNYLINKASKIKVYCYILASYKSPVYLKSKIVLLLIASIL